MNVLICGGRNWQDPVPIWCVLNGLLFEAESVGEKLTIIEGCARGADNVACTWYSGKKSYVKSGGKNRVVFAALHDNVIHDHNPADWKKYGKAAGPIRNEVMIDKKPELVVAFHNDLFSSKGTLSTLLLADARAIRTWVIKSNGPTKSMKSSF